MSDKTRKRLEQEPLWRRDPAMAFAIGFVAVLLLATAWVVLTGGGAPAQPKAPQATSPKQWSAPPPMTIDPSKKYFATIKTDVGDIRVELFADKTPKTVNNFVFLARQGFYDNTTFHRVIEDFMAQGGDPTGTGGGGPGYTFEDEIVPDLKFDQPGLLAMANRGPDTNGSQFFITFAPTPWLDTQHTIFGKVVEGMDVLPKIVRRDPQDPDASPATKVLTVVIEER
jgi:cyclophilin family peptidyl-prolyl cis-trans isomerase